MTGMSLYYISRAVLSALFALALALGGFTWWMAVAMGVPVALLQYLLILGVLVYFVSDFFLRRS